MNLPPFGRFLVMVLALFASMAISPVLAFAGKIVLFEPDGTPVVKYQSTVHKIKAGDTLVFSKGEEFYIERVIDHGENTLVLDIGGNKVLRIPLHNGYFVVNFEPMSSSDFQKVFFDSALQFMKDQLPAVKVYENESKPREFIVAEKLDIKFNLSDFLYARYGEPIDLTDPHWNALVEFMEKFWTYHSIEDFRPANIGWVKDRGWVLFDFIAVKKVPETYLGFSKEFYFMAHGPLPKEVYNEVYNRVLERRARYKECSTELAGF